MRLYALLALLVMLVAPLAAQSTEAELKSRLVLQPLYLRGQWKNDKLKFDGAGHPLGSSETVPFTMSGVEITSVDMNAHGLKLEGHRVALHFDGDAIDRMQLENIKLEVQAPTDGDFSPALDSIFTRDLADFVPTLPAWWLPYGRAHFLPGSVKGIDTSSKSAKDLIPGKPDSFLLPDQHRDVKHTGGAVSTPKVLFVAQPRFDKFARTLKVAGHVLVYLEVDTNGLPVEIRILKPLGVGLDEAAVNAVAQYKFKPAEENGLPVVVGMMVEVEFQVF